MAHSEKYEYEGMTYSEIFDAMDDNDIVDDWLEEVMEYVEHIEE